MPIGEYDLADLLTLVITDSAEGLSLHTGQQPVIHLGGEPHPVEGPPITPEDAEALLRTLATTAQIRALREDRTAELIYTFRASAQFRVRAKIEHGQIQLDLQPLSNS